MGTQEVTDTLDALKAKAATDGKSDIKLTEEEAERFKTAMADPEFMRMLRDYMEEMQDPAIRAEQEAYISELERQDCVPKGKEAVHPKPGFVIKTWFSRDGAEGDAAEKMFINVVTSPKIGQPHRSPCSQEGKEGGMWSLPHAVGPMRMENDHAGGHTTTFDVCFHPEALMWSERAKGFRQLVVTVSMDAVQRGYRSTSGHEMRIEQRYRILSGVKYKHGACATMLITVGGTGSEGDGNDGNGDSEHAPRSNGTAGASPTSRARTKTTEPTNRRKVMGERSKIDQKVKGSELQDEWDEKEGTEAASCPPPKSATNERARSGSGVAESSASDVKEVPLPKEEGEVSGSSAPSAPRRRSLPPLEAGEKRGRGGTVFTLLESEEFDIAGHTADRVRPVAAPQKLLLRVKLPPDAVPTRKLEVSVKPRRVTIGVAGDPEEHPPRYLDVELPYEVEDDSKCSARRDKRGLLVITMPVKPPAVSSLPPPPVEGTEAPFSRPDSKEFVDPEGGDVPEVESVVTKSRDAKEQPCRGAPPKQAVVGIVEVPDVIPHTVRLSVDRGVMRLAFAASSDETGREGRGERRVERPYYDEMELPGGVDGPKCNFEVADANLVIRLVKEPVADWNSLPAVTSKELKARELRAVIVGADRSQPEGEAMGVPARPGNGRNRPETSGRDASRASRAPEHGSGGLEDGHDRVKGALNPGLASLAYELD